MALAKAIGKRRSVRAFRGQGLTLRQISQLCWAGQGITDAEEGGRASPSAGGLYPVELYVVTHEGLYHYRPADHALRRRVVGDVRPALQKAALDQEMMSEAPVCMVIAAVAGRLARKYGRHAERYTRLEVGHVAQNILLQAVALGLGGVPVGAFSEGKVGALLKMPRGRRVYYLLPVGYARD
jgi:SagB-type dehydrogenase family enzyme